MSGVAAGVAAGGSAVACGATLVGGWPGAPPRPGPDDPLTEGVAATLRGEPAAGLAALERAAQGGDAVTAALAAAWGSRAAWLRACALPGGTVGGGTELLARADELWRHPAGPGEIPGPAALACTVLTDLLPRAASARTWLGPALVARDPDAALAGLLDDLEVARTRAEGEGQRAIAGLCLRLRADLAHRAGRSDLAAAAIEAAAVAAGDDPLEVAALHLLVGDHALAPASHPDAGDHVLVDGGLETSALPHHVERVEADPEAVDVAAAEAAYDRATAALGDHDHVARGVLELRRAGAARVRGDHAGWVTWADRAAATATAHDDHWLGHTAAVHGVLGRIAAGTSVKGAPAPAAAGRWGVTSGSFAYAAGLGTLLARAGRRWLLREADPDRAVAAHTAARELFTALGAGLSASQSRADGAAVAAAVGARAAAANGFERAYEEHVGRFADPARGADAWRRATSLAARLHQLQLAGADPAGLRRSSARLTDVATCEVPDTDGSSDEALRELATELAAGAETHATLAEGDAARDAGDGDVAADRYGRALDLAAAEGDDLSRAVTLARLGRPDDAVEAYRAHEVAAAEATERSLDALREALGDAAEAAIAQLDIRGAALRRAAAFHTRVGAAASAAAVFDELDRHDPSWADREDRPWTLLSDHGQVREEIGDLDRAAELHRTAVDAVERATAKLTRDEHRTTATADAARIHGRAARTALRRAAAAGDRLGADARHAFELAERGRARALAALLQLGGSTDAGDGEEHVARWLAASAQLELLHQLLAAERAAPAADPERVVDLETRIDAAGAELARCADELRAADPEVADAVAPGRAVTVDDVAAALPPGAVLVAQLLVDDDLLTWAIGHDGLLVADLTRHAPREVSVALHRFTDACASGAPWLEAGRRATTLLLSPVREALTGAGSILFVPSGTGHAAPLHALPVDDGILEDLAPVSVLPSAAVLRHRAVPRTPLPSRVLVVGDPEDAVLTPSGGGFPIPAAPLPAARVEARVVAAHHPDADLLIGADATGSAVVAAISDAGAVHLAAHAAVDPHAPLATAVLLAHGDQLRVADLVGRRLRAELVVLSACDSGRGAVTSGEEVIGLTRALLAAGAAGAVVSLWPVDDRTTAVLLAAFSEQLTAGVDPAAALRAARRQLRDLDTDGRSRAFADLAADVGAPAEAGGRRGLRRTTVPEATVLHPVDWAPFVYVGAVPAR